MELQFVKVNEKDGTRKVLGTWSCVAKERVVGICYDFIEGFLDAIHEETTMTFIKPCRMERDGFRFRKYHSNYEYRFEDGHGNVITTKLIEE